MSESRYPKVGARLGFSVVLAALATGFVFGQEMPEGLARKSPGDVGIEKDEAVVFVENFEEASLEQIKGRWDEVKAPKIMSFSEDVPAGSAGKRSLLMSHVGGQGTGGHLYRRVLPGYDQLYARFYVKFDPRCAPVHHFGTNLGGNNPPSRWPMVSAGNRTQGSKSFWVGVEPFGNSWRWDFYTYWMEMRTNPDKRYWGNDFVNDKTWKVHKGRWTCVELMVKMNDPVTTRNGELAMWIDGKPRIRNGQVISYVGPSFPKGKWVWDSWHAAPTGKPFEGLRWRSVEQLKANYVWIYLYITKAPQGHVSKVWFDDVVLATEYIGPLTPAE